MLEIFFKENKNPEATKEKIQRKNNIAILKLHMAKDSKNKIEKEQISRKIHLTYTTDKGLNIPSNNSQKLLIKSKKKCCTGKLTFLRN